MAISMDVFGVLVSWPGSGNYPAIHVAVEEWCRPKGHEKNKNVIALTADAIDADEFEMHINELIEQLQELKKTGRKKIEALKLKHPE